jgi:vanillate O-demethylase ferredoxin subunit
MQESANLQPSTHLELIIRQIRYEGRGINSYELVHPDGQPLPSFTAGAHIDVHLPGGLIRQYSLCSDPAEAHHYMIAVLKDENGRGCSKCLHEAWQVRKAIRVSVPRNNFPLGERAAKVILLGGGIGITPLKSMMHALLEQGRDFELHYCAKDSTSVAFREFFSENPDNARRVHFHFDGGNPQNGLDIAGLLRVADEDTEIYYCGPAGFMKACAQATEHWPKSAVHCEHFKAPERPTMDAGVLEASSSGPDSFQVQIASTGQLITVPPDESIAAALESAGVCIETSCVSGLCGTCRLRYLSGDVEHNDFILSDEEKSEYLTACVSRCKGDLLVLDL